MQAAATAMAAVADSFARVEIERCSSQSWIKVPKLRLFLRLACQGGLLLEKQNAASRTKGVVGRIGRAAPATARPRDRIPHTR